MAFRHLCLETNGIYMLCNKYNKHNVLAVGDPHAPYTREGYLEWCDRYFWAVDTEFPVEILPDETGLIIADAYYGEIVRMGPEEKLAAARRKKMTHKLAMDAARRLQAVLDPRV